MKRKKFVYKLCICAMLTAISIIIGIFCKSFLTWAVYYRVTFENLPIIFAGYCFGPVWGAVVGLAADIISCICSPNPVVNPLISLGAITVGLLSGLAPVVFRKKTVKFSLFVAVASAHLFGQVIIKSIAKIIFFAMPPICTLVGLGISVAVGTIEYFLILTLLKSKGLMKFLKGMTIYEL